MGICFKYCFEKNNENQLVNLSGGGGIRQSKLNELDKKKKLKPTMLIDNPKNSLIFKNPFNEMKKNEGQIIKLEEYNNKIPNEYLLEEEKDPYDLSQYSNNEELILEKPIIFNNEIIYYGNWNKDLKISGTGEMLILDSEKIYSIGIWKNGYFIKGRIYFKDGIYEGEVKDNTFNGNGKIKYKNGDIYEGNFENGRKNGNGKMIFKNKKEYNGNFENGEINGLGEMKFNDGTYYKGDFIHGKFDGNGYLKNINSNWEYNGNFKYGFINGSGKFIFNNGDFYEGNYENNIKNGKGKYFFNNGNYFIGILKNNVPEEGKFKINNIIYKCKFINGQLKEKKIENGNDNLNDDINLNNIKFQNENDYIGYILNFNNSSSNSVGNKYMNN